MKKVLILILFVFGSLFLQGCDRHGVTGVIQPKSVVISSESELFTLTVGETVQLSATVYPATASQVVSWSSNNEEVATVSVTGLVTTHKAGTVKISATAGTVSGYYFLTVKDEKPNIEEINIIGATELFVDDYLKLNYQTDPAGEEIEVLWISDNENVAVVDQNGRVFGKSVGTVVIRISYEDLSSQITLNIKARTTTPNSISIKGRYFMDVGATMKLSIETDPIGTINTVTYQSSNSSIAEVSAAGIVTAKKSGEVVITATSTVNSSLQANFNLEVRDYSITDEPLDVFKDVYAKTVNSIFGVANYQNEIVEGVNTLVRKSIGSGVIYKLWYTLKDGSIIDSVDDLLSFDDVEKYNYFLITNKHVVEGSDALKIYLHDEEVEIPAELIKYDQKVDLAVVFFSSERYFRPLEFSETVVGGEWVIAIGNPSGFQYSSSATHGIVSHPERYIEDDTDDDGVSDWSALYIQHDAAINPGNSGGPLLNTKGEIVGINTMKFAATDIDNMGFSIPSKTILELIPHLEKGEVPKRATLGISGNEIEKLIESPDPLKPIPEGITYGIYVVDVVEGASKSAGVQVGDIILKINNKKIRKTLDIRLELANIIVGNNDTVVLTVYRNGETLTFTLVY